MACVMEAYVNGVSTRKVDRLVEQLGIHGMSKDRVSALCGELDERVEGVRNPPLEGAFPYLWLDAKHLKVRDRGDVRSRALVVAYAVHETGRREVIGIDIGETESEAFWLEFCRGLRSRVSAVSACACPITMKASRRRSKGSSVVPGSAAVSTSSATCKATAAKASAASSQPLCADLRRP